MAQIPITVPDFTDVELAIIRDKLEDVRTILAPKFINLEPEDRTRYGSVNEKNKLVINKVSDFRENLPALSNPEIDWVSYNRNAKTRKNFMLVIDLINEVHELCNDPRTMVDYVLFGDASRDYKFTKYKAEDDGSNVAGFEDKYNALKQFFVSDSTGPTSPTV